MMTLLLQIFCISDFLLVLSSYCYFLPIVTQFFMYWNKNTYKLKGFQFLFSTARLVSPKHSPPPIERALGLTRLIHPGRSSGA
jgi:hypothetical protein